MRIDSANILAQSSRLPSLTSSEPANQRLASKPAHSGDRYTKSQHSSAQVIDAEYIEFYTPSTQSLQQERNVLDRRLEVETSSEESYRGSAQNQSKYPLKVHTAPPPGSYIDIFT